MRRKRTRQEGNELMSLPYKKVDLGGLFIALLTLVLAVDFPSPLRASAHGLVDQVSLTPTLNGISVDGVSFRWGQSFTPNQGNIVAVDVAWGTGCDSGVPVTTPMEIREVNADGSLGALVSTSFSVTIPAVDPFFSTGMAHHDIPAPITLTPSKRYAFVVAANAICAPFASTDYVSGSFIDNSESREADFIHSVHIDLVFRTFYDLPDPSDTTPPEVAITAVATPADGFQPGTTATSFPATVGSQSAIVQGTVSDNAGVSSVTVNGVTTLVTSGIWEAVDVPLVAGSNTIVATATDTANNASTDSVTVMVDVDVDDDGIANDIDGNSTVSPAQSNSTTPSTMFSDKVFVGGITSGVIVSRDAGMNVVITDDALGGVQAVVTAEPGTPGTRRVRIRLDGKVGTYRLRLGIYSLTDPPPASLVLETTAGGRGEYENGNYLVSVSEGGIAIITETGTGSINVQAEGDGTVAVNGSPVSPGHSLPTYDFCELVKLARAVTLPPALEDDLKNAIQNQTPFGVLFHRCDIAGGQNILVNAQAIAQQIDRRTTTYTVRFTAGGVVRTVTFRIRT